MAHFGKEGTVQRFRVARPKKLQGVQQGMRVVVGSAGEGGGLGRRVQTGEEKGMEMEGEEDNVLGRRMQTANETEGEEGSVPSHRTHFPNEQEEEISMSGHRVQPWEETAAELARMRRTPGGPGSQD